MNSLLRVGIDVGSTTIKVVVLNKERELIYKKYARHFSEINAVLKENLAALENVVKEKSFSLAMTVLLAWVLQSVLVCFLYRR